MQAADISAVYAPSTCMLTACMLTACMLTACMLIAGLSANGQMVHTIVSASATSRYSRGPSPRRRPHHASVGPHLRTQPCLARLPISSVRSPHLERVSQQRMFTLLTDLRRGAEAAEDEGCGGVDAKSAPTELADVCSGCGIPARPVQCVDLFPDVDTNMKQEGCVNPVAVPAPATWSETCGSD
eukprot:361172-Chlamydomonas_euryale.AAC.6